MPNNREGAELAAAPSLPKRKTKTSPAAVKRYKDKHYKKFQADIRAELYQSIEEYTSNEQISKAEFLTRAIEKLKK